MQPEWIMGLIGGMLIGLAGAVLLLGNGKIMGASGIIGGLIRAETKDAIDITGGETGFKLRQTIQYGTNGSQLASSTIAACPTTSSPFSSRRAATALRTESSSRWLA